LLQAQSLVVLQYMSSCVCEQQDLLTSQFASLFADSIQTFKGLQETQQEFADRQICPDLPIPLACSLERATVYY
jgi:hypothetical protein